MQSSDRPQTTIAPSLRDRVMAREDVEIAFMRPQGWDKESWINHMAFRFATVRNAERERCAKIADDHAANSKEERSVWAAEAIAALIRSET